VNTDGDEAHQIMGLWGATGGQNTGLCKVSML
jgi:hypothetical protein